jgi:hypothetical protein
MWRSVILLIFVLCGVYGQFRIEGALVDKSTGEPIPFVTVYALRSRQMSFSDLHGKFQIRIDSLPDTLVFQHIGYRKEERVITGKNEKLGVIVLDPVAIELPEVMIRPGPDPAKILLAHLRAHRERHLLENYSAYRYTSYNLVRVYIPDSFARRVSKAVDSFFQRQYLFVWESVTRRWHRKGKAPYEQVLVTRMSGLPDATFPLTPTQIQSLSFYSDYIKVLGIDFFGILHPRANYHYRFIVTDTLITADGDSVFTLVFTPKKEKDNHFEGKAVITSRDYAILAIEGRAYFPAYMPFFSYVTIQQVHKELQGFYFPIQLDTKLFYPIELRDTIRHADRSDSIEVKKAKVNAVFHFQSFIDSVAIGDSVDVVPSRPVNLEVMPMEQIPVDSLLARYRVTPQDSKIVATYPVLDSLFEKVKVVRVVGKLRKLGIGAYPITFFDVGLGHLIRANQVEGVRVGFGGVTNERWSSWWGWGGFLGYGFQDHKWKYALFGYLRPFHDRRWILKMGYQKDLVESGQMPNGIPGHKTLFQTDLFPSYALRDFFVSQMDYYENYSAEIYFPIFRTVTGRLGYAAYHIAPADSYFYRLPDSDLRFSSYYASLLQFRLRWAPHERYYLEKGEIYVEKPASFLCQLSLRQSLPWNFPYTLSENPYVLPSFFTADLSMQLKVFVGRHTWENLVQFGYASVKSPYFFLYHLPVAGSPSFLYSPFGYQLLPYSRFPSHFTFNGFSTFALTNILKIDKRHALDILIPVAVNYHFRDGRYFQYHLNRPVDGDGWYGEIGIVFQDLIPFPILESYSPGIFLSTRTYRFQNWQDHLRIGFKQSLRF